LLDKVHHIFELVQSIIFPWKLFVYCSGSQPFMVCGPLAETKHLCPPAHQWGFAISRHSYLVKASAGGPQ